MWKNPNNEKLRISIKNASESHFVQRFSTFVGMLKLFKSFNPQTILLLIVFAIALKFGYYLSVPQFYIPPNSWGTEILLGKLVNSWGASSSIWLILGQLSIIAQSLIINRLTTEYKLFPSDSFVPAALFLIITGFYPAWNVLSAPMLASWPILIAINNMLRLHITSSPRKLLYNTGILLTLATLFYLPSALFLIFIIWALAIRKTLYINDIAILLLGICTPLYFLAAGIYLTDYPWQSLSIEKLGLVNLPEYARIPQFTVAALVIILLLLIGTYYLNAQIEKSVEAVKRNWWIIISSLIISILFSVVQMGRETAFGYVFVIPASLIITSTWNAQGGKWIKIFCFWLMIAGLIYLQYF